MIQSLFDSEEEKKEAGKPEDLSVETAKTESSTENETVKNAVAQVETKSEEVSETLPEVNEIGDFNSLADDFESENIVKEIEFGDNFLELEKEFAKIEEEVRRESEKEIEEEKTESQTTFETKTEVEKKEPNPTQQGIFTSALNKSKQEKQTAAPLENNLPESVSIQDETIRSTDENQTVNADQVNENQGFILPNRAEPKPENSFLNQSSETPQIDYKPQSKAQIIRNSGLAWSAGVAFFGSVIFVLILGWFADLLLGTSPWMAVGGVVLGSIIGFLQLFRLTSQILKDNE